jgi:hypothetical protein
MGMDSGSVMETVRGWGKGKEDLETVDLVTDPGWGEDLVMEMGLDLGKGFHQGQDPRHREMAR